MSNFEYLDNILNDIFTPFSKEMMKNDTLSVNVYEDEDSLTFNFFVPGIKKEDISIDLVDNILKVEAKHQVDEKAKYLLKEIDSASYSRSFNLKNLHIKDINASLNDGVLKLKLTKDQNVIKKIDIE